MIFKNLVLQALGTIRFWFQHYLTHGAFPHIPIINTKTSSANPCLTHPSSPPPHYNSNSVQIITHLPLSNPHSNLLTQSFYCIMLAPHLPPPAPSLILVKTSTRTHNYEYGQALMVLDLHMRPVIVFLYLGTGPGGVY